jgi:hypothetical protein
VKEKVNIDEFNNFVILTNHVILDSPKRLECSHHGLKIQGLLEYDEVATKIYWNSKIIGKNPLK